MTLAMPPKRYARIAGVLYLIIAIFGGFAIGYVPSVIVATGDAATTAANLMANRALSGMGVLAVVVVMLSEIVLSVMLFVLLKPTSPTLSLVAMVSRLAMVLVMAVNLLINIMPMVLLSGAGDLSGFAPEQLRAASLLFFDAHRYGIYVWDMFFGFHLLVLGYLVFKSGYFPRALGAAMLIGSFGYFLEGLVHVTFFDSVALATIIVGLLVLASVSELAFAFWLLIRGPSAAAWDEKRATPATA